jgi:hypothetical protein
MKASLSICVIGLAVGSACVPKPIDLTAAIARAHSMHGIQRFEFSPTGAAIQLTKDDASFVIPVSGQFKWQKARISFDSLDSLTAAQLFLGPPRSVGSEADVVQGVFNQPKTAIDFPLPSGHFTAFRLELHIETTTPQVLIRRLEVVPFAFFDYRFNQHALVYLFALIFVVACVGPGALISVLFGRSNDETASSPYRGDFFLFLSIVFYFAFYLVFHLGWKAVLGTQATPALYLLGWLISMAILTWSALRRKNRARMRQLATENRNELVWYATLVFLSAFLLSFDHARPLTIYAFNNVAGAKTFGVINAHDNLFQYVNGKAIAEDEPFSKYYHDARLVYDVTAREILPGVLYSVIRKILAAFSWVVGDSYFLYTLFGTCLNAMVVFPGVRFAERYLPGQSLAKYALALSATAFFLGNIYYTWFKFAGAALFLSGLIILLEDNQRLSRWLWSGVLVGASTVMHTGNFLGVPLFLIWMTFHLAREVRPPWKALRGPALLVSIVAAFQIPWTLVKRIYLHPDNTLVVQHFFDGHQRTEGLLASVSAFIKQTPLSDQVFVRLHRLGASFRIAPLTEWATQLFHQPFSKQLVRYSGMELRYLAPLLYPPILFLAFAYLARRGWHATQANLPESQFHRREQVIVFAICGLTTLAMIVLTYGVFEPDVTINQPAGLLVLAHLILIGWIFRCGAVASKIFLVFSSLQAARLLACLLGRY